MSRDRRAQAKLRDADRSVRNQEMGGRLIRLGPRPTSASSSAGALSEATGVGVKTVCGSQQMAEMQNTPQQLVDG